MGPGRAAYVKSRDEMRSSRLAQRAAQSSPASPTAALGSRYDAVVNKKRRAVIMATGKSEDKALPQTDRRTLYETSRDAARNISVAAWAIRKHLDFITSFTFQARTGDAAFDTALEKRIRRWGKNECDAAARHPLARMIRLLEQCALVDGDAFLVKLADGRLQAIEADRICEAKTDDIPDKTRFAHGIEFDALGRAARYQVAKRSDNGLVFDTWLSAENVLVRGYYTRFDQVRGVTPLSAGLNCFRDLYENFELALVKAKLHNFFGLAVLRQATADGDGMNHLDKATGEAPTEETEKYDVKLTEGPFKVELSPGEDIKFLESNTPSSEFKNFSEFMIRTALTCCDIPYTFFDVRGSSYSGARQDLLQYYQSADVKRADLQTILDSITSWQLMRWIARGEIALPGAMKLDDVTWEWIPSGLPWIDPLKEIEAQAAAVAAGFTSTLRVCRQYGADANEIAAEEAAYIKLRAQLGLPSQAAKAPAPAASVPEDPNQQEEVVPA